MSHSTDDIERRLRADAPRLTVGPAPTAADLKHRAAVRRRRRSSVTAAACFGRLAAAVAVVPRPGDGLPNDDRPDATIAVAPSPPAEEAVHVKLVVNDAGVLEVRARRGDVFCAIPLEARDEPPADASVTGPSATEPLTLAVPFWQIEPAAQDRFIEAWIEAGQMPGLEV